MKMGIQNFYVFAMSFIKMKKQTVFKNEMISSDNYQDCPLRHLESTTKHLKKQLQNSYLIKYICKLLTEGKLLDEAHSKFLHNCTY